MATLENLPAKGNTSPFKILNLYDFREQF